MFRSDDEKYDCMERHDLYRGGGMTAAEIKDYKDNIGKEINLWGYSSCSLSPSLAFSFAWENKDSGHSKVLLHFDWWSNGANSYFLNAGAYDHEEEVLLYDG